jgi:hypothetical protein
MLSAHYKLISTRACSNHFFRKVFARWAGLQLGAGSDPSPGPVGQRAEKSRRRFTLSPWERAGFPMLPAAALVRPACQPHTGVGWLMGASKLAQEKRQQAAALQSCAPDGRLCSPQGEG